eukprot:TRINITY_DN32284_c0_g2_i1.p1 TRINITY_DN32284_c0_g2~~TRINITY_DN32284_c0_g2_i1.p1  ORF type:complete len:365 (-),score=108.47 TRINITY_DN32284_c0_g2_i1:126-1220(-)
MGCGASSAGGKYASEKEASKANGQESSKASTGAVEATAVHEVEAGETAESPKAVEASTKGGAAQAPAPAAARAAAVEQLPGSVAGSDGAAAAPAQAQAQVPSAWWSLHTDWLRHSACEILGAYNFFFEHIGIRKGWRTPPFKKEEVQGPFMASAEVVAVVRKRIDEQGGGMVLRQLEGSSHDFLWGWSPEKRPAQALEEFFRGLVFATLSDAKGLVEGLDSATVDYYVRSHPILEQSSAVATAACAEKGEAAVAVASDAPAAEAIALGDSVPAAEATIALGDSAPATAAVNEADSAAKAEETAPAAETPAQETAAAVVTASPDAAPVASDAAEAKDSATPAAAPMMLADAPAAPTLMLSDAPAG